jgi:hypothetical protein
MIYPQSIFNPGEVLDVYLDQECNISAGVGLLLEYRGSNLPFIIDEPIIYNTETWLVEIISSPIYPKGFKKLFKIRYIESLTTVANEHKEYNKELVKDNFNLLDIDTSFWKDRVDGSELENDIY